MFLCLAANEQAWQPSHIRPKKINFSGTVFWKMMWEGSFYFIFLIILLIKTTYLSNFRKFLAFCMCSNQLVHQKSTNKNQPKTNKMVASGGQIKLGLTTFNANTRNFFIWGVLNMTRAGPE